MSLTSANSTILLSIVPLFPVPSPLFGFAADDVFDVDQVKRAETLMGVDGILSGGFVWEEVKQTFTLQSDSPSCNIFDQWQTAEELFQDVYSASATIILPGLLAQFSCINGYLINASPMPSAKKLLQPRKFTIAWNSIIASPTL